MRSARVVLIWAVLAAAIGVPIALSLTSELLEWRGPVYIVGRARRDDRARPHARSAFADCRIFAGTVGLSRTPRSSLDRRRAGRGGTDPCRRALDHQSAGHDRRADLHIADAVLALGRDGDVGDLRRRASGGIPPPHWDCAHGASCTCRSPSSSSAAAWSMPCWSRARWRRYRRRPCARLSSRRRSRSSLTSMQRKPAR